MLDPETTLKWRIKWIKATNWEYWSFNKVYLITLPAWIYFSIKARSFFFFSASNPSIKNGGMLNESKEQIHPLLPKDFTPRSLFFLENTSFESIKLSLNQNRMPLPLVGKPNIGARGRGVKILRTEEDLKVFITEAGVDYHLQELVEYPLEIGLFYFREPGKTKGCITGIVRKEFLTVTGDGISSIKELVFKNSRALVYGEMLEKMMGDEFSKIPDKGQKKILSPYGNHARGALFLDESHEIDQQLLDSLDPIFQAIPGFYYGRLDIRFRSWDELKKGKAFSIIELNGAGAEPTHMYDPKHSIFFAWKEIIRHWYYLNKVSIMNHKNGHSYLSFKEGIEMFKEDAAWSKKLSKMPL